MYYCVFAWGHIPEAISTFEDLRVTWVGLVCKDQHFLVDLICSLIVFSRSDV